MKALGEPNGAAAPEMEGDMLDDISSPEEFSERIRALWVHIQSAPVDFLRRHPLGIVEVNRLLCVEDSEQLSISASILQRRLEVMDPLYVIQHYVEELQAGLSHRDDSIKILFLTQVGRILEDPEAVTEILNTPEILKQVIFLIAADKIAVAKAAIATLSRIAQTLHGLEALLTGNLLADLKSITFKNDIVRYRVYELITNMSSVSVDSLNYCVTSGIISDLIGELMGNDVLVRAACIEMVTSLARTHHGRQYLTREGIIDKISDIISEAQYDPFSGAYLPGFVKFFGTLAVVDSPRHICKVYPGFMEKLFSMAEGQNPTLFGAAMDSFSIVGSNIEGKTVLQKMGNRFQRVLNRIGSQAMSAPTEIKVRCLDAIASLLYLPSDEQTEDLLRMTESWFSSLSNQPFELLRRINSLPFPELHCGALRVFTAIANQPWAQQMMVASPGFVEYIVDRSGESDRAAKEAKYRLVKALANSKTAAQIFGNQHYQRLQEYLHEGSSYIPAVATTSNKGEIP